MTPRGLSHRVAALALAVSLLLWPAAQPAAAWDTSAHRLIIARAVETLPFPLKSYFGQQELALAQLCNDPSQWGAEEEPRPEHDYIKLDQYGRYPFAELPRDYNQAVRKFGRDTLNQRGVLPWQIGTYSLKLEEAFRKRQWDQVKLYSAILAHYVAAAHDPFKTTDNSNGGLSGQAGVAQRYTSSLVSRYQMFFIIRPSLAFKIDDPTRHAFGMIMETHTWVDNVLLADSQARAGKLAYNDEYYDAFYEGAGPILVRQLTAASQAVGSYWYTAWVNAGSPALPAR